MGEGRRLLSRRGVGWKGDVIYPDSQIKLKMFAALEAAEHNPTALYLAPLMFLYSNSRLP
jgi:hypothetical protein